MQKLLIEEIKNLIKKAGRISLDLKDEGLFIETKKDGSPVSNADKAISAFIYSKLSKLTPKIPIICEERKLVKVDINKPFWLVDPIDGTKSYIKNKDSYTVNIALVENLIPIAGFIYHPPADTLYYTDEKRNFCVEYGSNDKQVSQNLYAEDSYIAVISSRGSSDMRTMNYLKEKQVSEIITIPSSIKFCMIAEGRADIYPKFGTTMEWDIAAGHAIVRAAGGDVTMLDSSPMIYAKENFKNTQFLAVSKKWLGKE